MDGRYLNGLVTLANGYQEGINQQTDLIENDTVQLKVLQDEIERTHKRIADATRERATLASELMSVNEIVRRHEDQALYEQRQLVGKQLYDLTRAEESAGSAWGKGKASA